MRLGRLRNQMLIAMGLVPHAACWTSATTAPQPVPPPAPKVSLQFDPAACPQDSIPESVCGERRETARACGARATNLDTVEESKLYLTEEDSDEPAVTYREFRFDREETRRYRDDLDDPTTRGSYCCYSQCTPMVVGRADPVAPQAGHGTDQKCMPAPPNGTSKPAKGDASCAEGVSIDGTLRPYVATEDGECCYAVPMRHIQIHSIPGRALRIDGQPQVAEVVRGGPRLAPDGSSRFAEVVPGGERPRHAAHGDDDGRPLAGSRIAVERESGWTAMVSPSLDLDPDVRAGLATSWLEIAQLEHASVAAFAALALRLIAAGAPPALIAAAHEAALDEVRHAQIAFALASAYGGEQIGPGRFESARRARTDGDLRALALETFVDGCINETAAAREAELAAESARDPGVAAALAEIAVDEARHGALAWAIVAWCVREGAVTVAELRELAATTPGFAESCTETTGSTFGELAAHGVLGPAASAAVRRDVLSEIITPCLEALAA